MVVSGDIVDWLVDGPALEAVSLLVPGRGLRRAKLTDISRRLPKEAASEGQAPRAWAVAARIDNGTGLVDVGTGLAPDAVSGDRGSARRAVRIDGETARGQVALGTCLAALWLTPDMQRLFVEGASGRRRFLDRLVFSYDPAHAGRLQGYDRAMRDRTRVLGEAAKAGRSPDPAWLSALEETMVEKGIAIAAARADLVRRLNPACSMGVGPFPAAGMVVSGDIVDWLVDGPALEAEDRFAAALVHARARDSVARGASVGVHHSDFEVTHLDKNIPAAQCSTGEQKALLISIVLANARLQTLDAGAVPLLLLDEIAAHLDTDAALFAPLGTAAQHFAVADAKVRPVP
jgi:DNA replication and repair protein RecF